jgi:hypothetical protein
VVQLHTKSAGSMMQHNKLTAGLLPTTQVNVYLKKSVLFLQGVWWQSFGVGPVGIPLFCAVINAYYFCMYNSTFWHQHLQHAPALPCSCLI